MRFWRLCARYWLAEEAILSEPGVALIPDVPPIGAAPAAGATQAASSAPRGGGIVQAAGINALGNVASRVLGLLRESIVAGTFGVSGATSAFDAVSGVPKMVYELLVGGMLSAALVPVLSEYAAEKRQEELEKVLSILLSLSGIILLVVVILLEVAAPWITPILVGGFDARLLSTATLLVRLIVPSIFIYGLSGMIQAYHYARQRFVYPSMGAPAHNLGVILAVVLLASRLGIASLSVSILVAALVQFLAQLPGLRGVHLSLNFDWRHPAVRRILHLYAPVVLSIVISNVGVIIDRNLASRTVEEAITWMTKATFLIQLPLGLVSMAISLAVLPALSQVDAAVDPHRFKSILSQGLRLVLVLVVPVGAGMLALGRPVIELIFQHGEFTAQDTQHSLWALLCYLPGLPFAAIDLPLVFAFYAQKRTITPVLVGIAATFLYLAVGPTLAFLAGWGFLGLVVANSVQLTGHAVIMLVVFTRHFGGLGGYGVLRTALRVCGASVVVAATCYGGYVLLNAMALPGGFLVSRALTVLLCTGLGAAGYLAMGRLLHIDDLSMLINLVRRRLLARG
jgi:putative peptidoglycan lipid II flippase